MSDFFLKLKDWLPEFGGKFREFLYVDQPPEYLTSTSVNKVSLMILPGIFTEWPFYKPLIDRVSNEGYSVHVIPQLGNNGWDIPTSAKIVKKFIEKNKLDHIVFFGHSKGGLIGKYYLKYLNQDKKVFKLIAISTPFHGASLAKLVPLNLADEYLPSSPFLQDLNSSEKENKDIISLIPRIDVIVRNKESMKVKGGRDIYLKSGGHNRAMNTQEVSEIVKKLLDEFSSESN